MNETNEQTNGEIATIERIYEMNRTRTTRNIGAGEAWFGMREWYAPICYPVNGYVLADIIGRFFSL
jgi:hypothetical protein